MAALPPGLDAPAPDEWRGGVVAIGNFDGIHRGHQALLATARDEAGKLATFPLVMTFEPHPRAVLRPDPPFPRITPEQTKLRVLGAAGYGRVAVLAFDRALAGVPAEDFVRGILVGRYGVRGAVIGADFRFGQGRGGDAALMAAVGGFPVTTVPPVLDEAGLPFSSGRIRAALAAGEVAGANAGLGYRWFTAGTVIGGDRRGRELGFPTANLRTASPLGLRFGIYAVTATRADGTRLPAVASYGIRPTFGDNAPLLEVHIFDFAGDLYGETLTVTFHAWLRGEEKFESVDALVAQIERDAAAARQAIAAADDGTALDRALLAAAVGAPR